MTKEKNFHMKIDRKTDVFSSEVEKFGEEKSIRIAFWLNGFERARKHTRFEWGRGARRWWKEIFLLMYKTFGELFMNHAETADKRPVSAIIPYALLLCNSLSLLFLNVS